MKRQTNTPLGCLYCLIGALTAGLGFIPATLMFTYGVILIIIGIGIDSMDFIDSDPDVFYVIFIWPIAVALGAFFGSLGAVFARWQANSED